jgi:peptidoglycan hydrolase-like protein with peptidoglycan-binding domain
MQRRRFLAGLGGLVVLGAAGAAGVAAGRDDGSGGSGSTATTTPRTTRKLEVRDLAETTDVSGTLGFGNSRALPLAAHGTITALPAPGAIIDRGQELAEVDGAPVSVLFGDRPAWRAFPPPPGADGPDIQQLEANLIALGHGTASTLGPNGTWSDATTAAVKRWQKALGTPQTGTIDLGRVVFEPGPVRVEKHLAEPGAPAGGPTLQVTDTTRTVHVDLAASLQSDVHQGDAVTVELPSGTTADATVTSVGTVAQQGSGQDSSVTLPVEISLTDPAAAGDLDQAPVTVHLLTSEVKGALAAPVQALLALAEGGYAVQRVTGPAATKLVAVKLGASADGWVQVTGEVHEGDEVVVAP